MLQRFRKWLNDAANPQTNTLTTLTDRSASRSHKNISSLFSVFAALSILPAIGVLYQWSMFVTAIISNPTSKDNGIFLLLWPLYLFQFGILFCSVHIARFFYKKSKAQSTKANEKTVPTLKV